LTKKQKGGKMNHKQRKKKRRGKRVKEPYFAANGMLFKNKKPFSAPLELRRAGRKK